MSEVKNSSQVIQDVKKPYTYEGNDTDLKNVISHLTNNTNTQRQILKILEEGTSNYSKIEKTLSGVRNDLRDILKSTQNNNTNGRDSDLVKHVKSRLSDMQSQLKAVNNVITTMNQPKQKNKVKEEKRKNKELKKEEKRKNKELKKGENNKKNFKKTINKVKKSIK